MTHEEAEDIARKVQRGLIEIRRHLADIRNVNRSLRQIIKDHERYNEMPFRNRIWTDPPAKLTF